MELRKVQLTGGSSYIITLPKEWVKSANIRKNDSVGVIVQPDGTLLITPKITEERDTSTKEFFADDIRDPDYLFRILVGAYIMGYNNIVVRSRKEISPFIHDTVTKFTRLAIGPEIIEESHESIMITDLLNPTEMPFNRTIRRMHLLVRSMHSDALESLQKRDSTMCRFIQSRDSDVDRLEWLVARQSNIVFKNAILAKKLGIRAEEANHYYLISRAIERIGDHAVRISENVPILIEDKISDGLVKQISEATGAALDILDNSIDALLKKDINLANSVIEKKKQLTEMCEELINYPLEGEDRFKIAVSHIAESIRRTGDYSTDISEIVINNLM